MRDRSVWTAADLSQDDSWHHRLTESEREDLATAMDSVTGRAITAVTSDSFSLPVTGSLFERVGALVREDRGFFVLRGLPIKGRSLSDLENMMGGISSHLGRVLRQDVDGRMVTYVQDAGHDYQDIAVVGGQTNAKLTPHCDTGDLNVLVCVRPAKQGGTTYVASSSTIYNRILETQPEYLDVLFEGFHYNIRDRGPLGRWANVTRHKVPVFVISGGRLYARFNEKAILTAEEWGLTPPLSGFDRDAVAAVAKSAEQGDLHYPVSLESGDLVVFNSRTTLHHRSAFQDGSSGRLLLRTWVDMPNGPSLPDVFTDHWNTGPRGGMAQRNDSNDELVGTSSLDGAKRPTSRPARRSDRK